MTCEPISDSGFSNTGFISITGLTPHAIACMAWALPISPPSVVTEALFDIFCGLNGKTFKPLFVKALHRPATIIDLPTLEPAPCIIIDFTIFISHFCNLIYIYDNKIAVNQKIHLFDIKSLTKLYVSSCTIYLSLV